MTDMALYHYKRIVRDSDGDVVPSVTIEVNQAGSETNQAIFSDSGGTAKSNPFTSDSDGVYEFWVDEGAEIDIDFTKTGFSIDSLDGETIPWITTSAEEARTLTGTDPIQIDGASGTAQDLSADRTISIDESDYTLLSGRAGGQEVNGSPTAGEHLRLTGNSTDGVSVTINDTGVGIGETTPAQLLHISASGASTIRMEDTALSKSWHFGPNSSSRFVINEQTAPGSAEIAIDPGEVYIPNGVLGVGTTSPDAAAALDVESTTSGVLFPRMTTTQRDAISSPPDGLVIYNTSLSKLQVRAGGAWVSLH